MWNQIGADQIAGTVLELLHAAIGVSNPVDGVTGVHPRHERILPRAPPIPSSTKSSATKSSVGVDCRCQESTSGSSMFQSVLGLTYRTTWWWTQSCETGLQRGLQGKYRGNLLENALRS